MTAEELASLQKSLDDCAEYLRHVQLLLAELVQIEAATPQGEAAADGSSE